MEHVHGNVGTHGGQKRASAWSWKYRGLCVSEMWMLELNLDPQGEQPVLITAESSLSESFLVSSWDGSHDTQADLELAM